MRGPAHSAQVFIAPSVGPHPPGTTWSWSLGETASHPCGVNPHPFTCSRIVAGQEGGMVPRRLGCVLVALVTTGSLSACDYTRTAKAQELCGRYDDLAGSVQK